MKRILLVADSFGLVDERYPGTHFSEKIKEKFPELEVINLSCGGVSNDFIRLMVRYGLEEFESDAVILLCSTVHRAIWDRRMVPGSVLKEMLTVHVQDLGENFLNSYLKSTTIFSPYIKSNESKAVVRESKIYDVNKNYEIGRAHV